LGAFLYEEDEIYYQEIALYKVPTKIFLHGNKIENLVRSNNARILVIEEDYIVIEKTGHKQETQQLFNLLNEYGVLEFVRSGRVAISKSKRRTQHYLDELENSETHIVNSNGQDKYGKN
jgi:acetolactate synthase I/III small subunit